MEKLFDMIAKLVENSRVKYFKYVMTDKELNVVLLLKNKRIFLHFQFNNPVLNKIYEISRNEDLNEQFNKIYDDISENILANTKIIKMKTNNFDVKIARKLY
jgi:hypothetical protein